MTTIPSFATFLNSVPAVQQKIDDAPTQVTGGTKVQIPVDFDGRRIWGSYLSPVLNQGVCGACYAFAPISTLMDRYTIFTQGQVRPFFNPLEAAMCLVADLDQEDFERLVSGQDLPFLQQEEEERRRPPCNGNSMYNIGRLLYRSGAVSATCVGLDTLQNFMLDNGHLPSCPAIEGRRQAMCCTSINPAPNVFSGHHSCYRTDPKRTAQQQWPARLYYTVPGTGPALVAQLQEEILRWGPVAMAFRVFEDFLHFDFSRGDVYTPAPDAQPISENVGHAVRVIGWGSQPVPHWLCVNSWGPLWGEGGFFRIVRGDPRLRMEENHMCVWPEVGWEPPAWSIRPSSMQKLDDAERAINDVSPWNFYPQSSRKLIKAGIVRGDLLTRVIPPLPGGPEDFWASEVGEEPSAEVASILAAETQEEVTAKVSTSQLVWLLVMATAIVVGLSFIPGKRARKGREGKSQPGVLKKELNSK